ncbi:MAG: dihydropteroate synthase [gamma proteobacterium symbiont of Taylorina sp.]|nr:dihydropteroate synthase [gamma proteobacterium symbiont of Taylorina sp.]
MTRQSFQCANRTLDLSSPVVMGILNVTPDSFSDGGLYTHVDSAFLQAKKMLQEGADIIDIGGESTKPGAQKVNEAEELDRVIPVIEKLNQELDVIVSIDTSKAIVMVEAAHAGAGLINDVNALQSDDSLNAAYKTGLPVCLMHMQGEPGNMQIQPQYDNVVSEVKSFLQQRAECCIAEGINKNQIIIDPGFGFGKTLEHNICLFKHLKELANLGYPVLVGASRKSMLGQMTGRATEDRLAASLALATLATVSGASILRVHDVAETVDAVKVARTLTLK